MEGQQAVMDRKNTWLTKKVDSESSNNIGSL